jgi:PAS domain S-box-containing protein
MSTIRLRAATDGSPSVNAPLRAVVDAMAALVWLAAPDGNAVCIGRRWLALTGLTAEQALGWGWASAVHRDDVARLTQSWQAAVTSGAALEIEARLRRADGQYRRFLFCTEPLRDDSGTITGFCATFVDIEDRKRAEDLERASQQELRTIVDNIPAMIAIHDATGATELSNRDAQDFHRSSLDEVIHWETGGIVHPEDVPALVATRERALKSGEMQELEYRVRRGDGVYRWVEMRVRRASEGDRWFCVGTDVHDRRTAEDKLRRSEAFLLEVQRLSRTGGWRFDPASGIVESSPEIQRVYDVQPGEDITRPAFWFGRIHPEDRPRVQAHFEQCLRDRKDYRAGYRIVLPDGSVRYQHATGHLVANAAGDVIEIIGAQMDMTEHWLATTELERASQAVRDLQLKMARAAQVASVGELAASIAHEVNQPLAAVVANGHACLRWLAASPPNVPKAVEALERLVKDGKDAGEVVRRVRALFRRTTVEKAPLDINEVILEVLRLLNSYPARKHVELDTALDSELAAVFADRVQLQQLVLNLVLNALEALEPVSDRAKKLSVRTKRAEDGGTSIQITDNGIGLDDPQAVFEAFYTTKPEGMGLGLAICRSIVSAHDGKLSAERNVGFGTTFTVTLPITQARSA